MWRLQGRWASTLGPQVLQGALQGWPSRLLRAAIPPHRRLGTLAARGALPGWPIDPVCPRVDPSCGGALRALPDLQKSG